MIEIKLYKTADDQNKVSKNLTAEKVYTGTLKNGVSVLTPQFSIKSADDLTQYNYCYIPSMHRYYFIRSIDIAVTGFYIFTCRCDVLMSYKDQILNCTGTIDRNENKRNSYIVDSGYQALNYELIGTRPFPNEMNNDSFILMTVG